MFFTEEDYKKIEKWLLHKSKKDTDFKEANDLVGDESISLILNNHNVKVSIRDFISLLLDLKITDFINISSRYNAKNITLEEAIRLVKYTARKEGLVITFLNTKGKWQIYQFKGVLNQWNHTDLWEDLFDFNKYVINPILPDEEDLTKSEPDENGNSYLFLKDREYNPEEFSGLGRVILRKNIVEIENSKLEKVKKNILLQNVFAYPNTIYECRYDYDLNGLNIILPNNSYIEYKGGSISNGTIIDNAKGLNKIILRKNIKESKNILIQDMINVPNTIYCIRYDYDLDNNIIQIPENCILLFEGGSFKNGILLGNNTFIKSYKYYILKNIKLGEGFINDEYIAEWFGLNTNNEDNSIIFNNLFTDSLISQIKSLGIFILKFGPGVYKFKSTIYPKGIIIKGNVPNHYMDYGFIEKEKKIGNSITTFWYKPTNLGNSIIVTPDLDSLNKEQVDNILNLEEQSIFIDCYNSKASIVIDDEKISGTLGIEIYNIKFVGCPETPYPTHWNNPINSNNNTIAISSYGKLILKNCSFLSFNTVILKHATLYSFIFNCNVNIIDYFIKWSNTSGSIDTTSIISKCTISNAKKVIYILPYSKYLKLTVVYDLKLEDITVLGCEEFLESWDRNALLITINNAYFEANDNESKNKYLINLKISENYYNSSTDKHFLVSNYIIENPISTGGLFLDVNYGSVIIKGGVLGTTKISNATMFRVDDYKNPINSINFKVLDSIINTPNIFSLDSFVLNYKVLRYIYIRDIPLIPKFRDYSLETNYIKLGFNKKDSIKLLNDVDNNFKLNMSDNSIITANTDNVTFFDSFHTINKKDCLLKINKCYDKEIFSNIAGIRNIDNRFIELVSSIKPYSGVLHNCNGEYLSDNFTSLLYTYSFRPYRLRGYFTVNTNTSYNNNELLFVLLNNETLKIFTFNAKCLFIGELLPTIFLPKGFIFYNTLDKDLYMNKNNSKGTLYYLNITGLSEENQGTLIFNINGLLTTITLKGTKELVIKNIIKSFIDKDCKCYVHNTANINELTVIYNNLFSLELSVTSNNSSIIINIVKQQDLITNSWINITNNKYLLRKGDSLHRPSNINIGFTYKDTTLNKWIIWNGDAWENIDGTAL